MAVVSNLIVDQGTDFAVSIVYKNDDGTLKDLTGYQVRSQMRRSYYSTSNTAFTAGFVDAVLGEIELSLSANTTNSLKPGRYVYDVEVVDTNSKVTRIVEGLVTVLPGVTR